MTRLHKVALSHHLGSELILWWEKFPSWFEFWHFLTKQSVVFFNPSIIFLIVGFFLLSLSSRWRNHQEHQRAVSCPRGAAEKPAAQHRPQHAHLLHPGHLSTVGKGPPADRWENWGRWSGSPGACPKPLSGLIFMSAHVNAESCWGELGRCGPGGRQDVTRG